MRQRLRALRMRVGCVEYECQKFCVAGLAQRTVQSNRKATQIRFYCFAFLALLASTVD